MNLTDDDILKFQCGIPIFLEDICAIYSVTLREIVEVGYTKFQQYLSVLTIEKPVASSKENSEFKELIEQLTDYQYLLMMASLDSDVNRILKEAFQFFTHEEAFFSLEPAQIIIGPLNEKHILTEDKFYDFQRIIKRMYFLDSEGEEIIIYNDDPPYTKKLKMQMRANREKVRRAKAKEAQKKGGTLNFSDLIGSITINACGLNMENIWNLTYYAFHDQLKRMGWRDQFNINSQAALAGAKLNKNQLKHWMRSINDSKT